MYSSCSYNGTSDDIWNTKATRETVGCLEYSFCETIIKVQKSQRSRTIVLICLIPLYTHLNHMSRSLVNSFCMSQKWRSTATDSRVPLTSYSTAKLAKSSGVSSPWDDDFNRLQLGYLEANDISGWFVIADLHHVASGYLVIVNLFYTPSNVILFPVWMTIYGRLRSLIVHPWMELYTN